MTRNERELVKNLVWELLRDEDRNFGLGSVTFLPVGLVPMSALRSQLPRLSSQQITLTVRRLIPQVESVVRGGDRFLKFPSLSRARIQFCFATKLKIDWMSSHRQRPFAIDHDALAALNRIGSSKRSQLPSDSP